MENQKRKNKWKILCLVLMGPLIATIDASIVNVALPDMATKLSASIDTIQWVCNKLFNCNFSINFNIWKNRRLNWKI
jgi:hypothetical protein